MTGGQFREVDVDLLADYVGGALDGTPEAAEVARLIAEDPAWAEAYAELTAGIEAVRLDLATLAAEPEPMPPAVIDRLDAVLTRPALTGTAGPTPAARESQVPSDSPAASESRVSRESPDRQGARVARRRPRRRATVPTQPRSAPASAPAGPGRRWTRRVAGPVVVVAAVAGFGAFALSRLGTGDGTRSAADSAYTAGSNPEQAPLLSAGPSRPVPRPSAGRVLATGTDYTSRTLAGTITTLVGQATAAAGSSPDVQPRDARTSAAPTGRPDRHDTDGPGLPTLFPPATATQRVPGLERLAEPDVLARCLDAVAAAHAQGPITVELVDFASFEGRASLVILFVDPTGSRWAWATGPGCGTSATGADVTYQTRVG